MSERTMNPGVRRRGEIDPVPVLKTILGVFLAGFITIILGLAMGVHGGDVICLLLAILTILIGSVPLAADLGRPRMQRHIFLSMLAVVYTIGYVIPIFVHYLPAVGPMDPPAMASTNLLPSDIAKGQWLAIIGLLSLYAGYALPMGRILRPILPQKGYEWNHGAAIVSTCLIMFVGWTVFLGRSFGFIPASLGSGILGGIASSILFGSALLTAIYLKYRSRSALIILSLFLPVTMLISFTTGSKKMVLMPAAMVVLTWVVTERRIRLRWLVAGVLAIVLLYPVARFWRGDILQANTLTMADVVRHPGAALSRTEYFLTSGRLSDYMAEGFEATSNRLDIIGVVSVIARDTPSVSPFQNGRTLALIPLAFIPRILWPNKPKITIGQWVTETYVPHGYLLESNLGTSWVGEFYLNFGIPCVMAGMAVLGLMLRVAHEILMRPRATIPLIAAAVIVISTTTMGLDGGVVMAVNTPVVQLLPLAIVHLLMRIMGGTQRVSLETDPSGSGGTASASDDPLFASSRASW